MRHSQRLLVTLLLKAVVVIGCVGSISVVSAEACTYNEALMAFQQGNIVRGQTLLSMAAKDGDQRAIKLFSSLQDVVQDGDDNAVAALRTLLASETGEQK